MRILQLCSVNTFGGGERHLADLARGLHARGHEVYAAAFPGSPLHAELSFLPEGNVFALKRRSYAKNLVGLAGFMRERGIEIIHAHAARDYHLAALAVRLAPRGRLVLTRHALFPLGRIHRLILRPAARFIAVSGAVAESLSNRGVIDPAKIVVIHNGVDVDRYASAGSRGRDYRRPLVGTIGHLGPIKGQDVLVLAAARVIPHREGVRFVIVGADKSSGQPFRRRLDHMVDELGLVKHVNLIGWRDDVAEVLSTFSLFISPARSEPFGLAIVEAMASGLAVVATASEGAREIIEDGVTGRLVPVGDPLALAGAIEDLLDAPAECERLGRNARRAARERFSLERMVRDTERVYGEVLSGMTQP
ncbi:MAG TPA: glycosyltransferase family 4 protein [Pyrinomonadaceae bacterium]|jgi:glycosyltransferase involved in cell wall biosynthesis